MPCRYKKQRLRYILTLLKKQGSVKISSLVKVLDVTERTLRRDINDLVKTGHVRSCYGGAVYNHDNAFPLYENNSLYLHQNIIINQSKIEREISMNENNGKVYILGSFNTDLVYRLHRFPISGETTRALFSCCLPGGKGSHQAIASAQANARTYFTVKLGEDEFSTKAQHFLNGVGLEKLTIFTKNDAPTGSAVVMISEEAGDNVIVINPGANQEITSEEIISCYDEIGTANVFLTQMENNPNATAQAIKFAHAAGVMTILNPAPWRKEVTDLLRWTHILTPNLTEAEAIIGKAIRTPDDIRQAAETMHQMGPQYILITLGKDGCWLFDGSTHQQFPAYPAVNIDTSGAGDAFNGALAARLACGENIANAIHYACVFSALAVEREGAANMPSHELVLKRLACNKY